MQKQGLRNLKTGQWNSSRKRNRKKKSEDSLQDLQDNIKQNNINISVNSREKRGRDRNLFKGIING